MNSKEYEGLHSDLMVLVERVVELEKKVDLLWNRYLNRLEEKGL